jgi:hypothetical protein
MAGKPLPPYTPAKRRLVLFFPGFEPLGADAHRGRFAHAAEKTGTAYGAAFSCSGLTVRPSGLPGFSVAASGPGWSTQSEVALFDWSAILEQFEQRNTLDRLIAGIAALLGLVVNGTLLKYLRTSWRYGFFFLYPLVLLAGCAAIGVLAGSLSTLFFASRLPQLATGALAALAAFHWAASKAHLLLMMDDWEFAVRVARRDNPAIEAVRAAFAKHLAAECASKNYDEALVIGHSLGCVFAVDALAQSGLPARLMPSLMTVGSSLLKIALDPNAAWLRQAIATVTSYDVMWLDVQALTDVISFYRSNPALSAGIQASLLPMVRRIHFKDMLQDQSYRRNRRNLFKTHRQFVLGVEKRYFYSMHMIACGPLPFAEVWRAGGIADGDPLVDNGAEERRFR